MKVESLKLKVKSCLEKLFTVHCSLFTNKKGFTLIEAIIVITIIGIIAGVTAMVITEGTKGYIFSESRNEALDQARIAMERMTREIRNTRDNQSICNATATNIDFYGFTDDTANPVKRIEFTLSGTTNIQRRENAGTWYNLASGNPITLTLTYYDASGNILPAPTVGCTTTTNIKRIRIAITVTTTTSGQSVTLQSEVYPRNL
ncbi:MAG: prepilin-type N-terminal cleavage/methylation domain-containing protein [Nitrospirae bacterium]|nr:prepilin-type N-terminal cleavage/methylation domain-containing protein [Nitrospirota bacterium]